MGVAKRWMRTALRPFGYRLVRQSSEWRFPGLAVAPRTVVDVGCADGTLDLYGAFPEADLLLIDPVREYEPALRRLLAQRRGVYAPVAAGATPGELAMHVVPQRPELSSLLDRLPDPRFVAEVSEQRTVPVRTVDGLVAEHGLKGPYGLKIDVEGYELEVVRGATETLRESMFVVAETSLLPRFEGGYRFLDLALELDRYGFEPATILYVRVTKDGRTPWANILYLPREQRLAQHVCKGAAARTPEWAERPACAT